jgi:hypothetical protein
VLCVGGLGVGAAELSGFGPQFQLAWRTRHTGAEGDATMATVLVSNQLARAKPMDPDVVITGCSTGIGSARDGNRED